MNKNNYIFYAIIIYIIIISLLIIIKPNFIYDHDNLKFKKFGHSKDKTLFSIGILAIVLAIIVIIIFSFGGKEEKIDNTDKDKIILSKDDLYKLLGGNMQYNIPYQILPYILQHYQIPQIIQSPIIQPPIIQQIIPQLQEITQTK